MSPDILFYVTYASFPSTLQSDDLMLQTLLRKQQLPFFPNDTGKTKDEQVKPVAGVGRGRREACACSLNTQKAEAEDHKFKTWATW